MSEICAFPPAMFCGMNLLAVPNVKMVGYIGAIKKYVTISVPTPAEPSNDAARAVMIMTRIE